MKTKLLGAAKAVLANNWYEEAFWSSPDDKDSFDVLKMLIAVLGTAHYNSHRAYGAILTILDAQLPEGRLPRFINAKNKSLSKLIAPPLLAIVLHHWYGQSKDQKKALKLLAQSFPALMRYHRFLYEKRDPLDEGLICIYHPQETFLPGNPVWKELLKKRNVISSREIERPVSVGPGRRIFDPSPFPEDIKLDPSFPAGDNKFRVCDPAFNGLLVWANECLIEIGKVLGEDVLEFIQLNELTIFSMNDRLWNAELGIYTAYDLQAQRQVPLDSPASFIPMVGEVPTQEQAESILAILESEKFSGHGSDGYLCPSLAKYSPHYKPDQQAAGAISPLINWLLAKGLQRYEMFDAANRLKEETLEILARNDFYDFFDSRKQGQQKKQGKEAKHSISSAAITINLILETDNSSNLFQMLAELLA